MSKQTIIKIITILVAFTVIGLVLYLVLDTSTTDEAKFKSEYENINGETNDEGRKTLAIEIPKDNNIEYLEIDEVFEFLDEGTGILYFGFPECPWCRNAVPVLIDAAKENEIQHIYYYNALSIRDTKELNENGEVVTTKEGTEEYYKLVDRLKDYLNPYDGLNDDSIKRLYFPTVFFVRGGEIMAMHEGTVDSQENPYKALTKKQTKELNQIYTNHINKIYGTCDENC